MRYLVRLSELCFLAVFLLPVLVWAQVDIINVIPSKLNRCDGTIEVLAQGSASPFCIIIEMVDGDKRIERCGVNGAEEFDNLCSGDYIIRVIDSEGCEILFMELIEQCMEFSLSAPSISQPASCGSNDGSFYWYNFDLDGATLPVSFLWNTG